MIYFHHELKISHGRLRTSNVLLNSQGRVKLGKREAHSLSNTADIGKAKAAVSILESRKKFDGDCRDLYSLFSNEILQLQGEQPEQRWFPLLNHVSQKKLFLALDTVPHPSRKPTDLEACYCLSSIVQETRNGVDEHAEPFDESTFAYMIEDRRTRRAFGAA